MSGVRAQPAETGGRPLSHACSRLAVAFLGTWLGGTVVPAPLTVAAPTSVDSEVRAAHLSVGGIGDWLGSTAHSLATMRTFSPAGIHYEAISTAALGASNGRWDAHVARAEWQALGPPDDVPKPALWRAALTAALVLPRSDGAWESQATASSSSSQSEPAQNDNRALTSAAIGAASVNLSAHIEPSRITRETARQAPAEFARHELSAQPIALPGPASFTSEFEQRHKPAAAAQDADTGRAALPSGFDVFGSVAIRSESKALTRLIGNALVEATTSTLACSVDLRTGVCAEIKRIPGPWEMLISELKDLSPRAKVERANREVNQRIRYVTDQALHGIPDLWSGPHATMAEGAGDCEDFAILKMWLLAQAGIAAQDMAVIVVRAPHLRTEHAVLAVRLLGTEAHEGTLILDNLAEAVRPARVAGYSPIFSANATGLWLHGFPARRELAGR